MITVRAGSGAIGVCLLLLAAGCSREQQDWRSAEAADTIEAYGQFIRRHPESELATQARTRVAQLGEDRDWQHAGSADTVQAYRDFIAQHPNGKWAQEAHIRIENFSLGEQAGTDAASKAGSGLTASRGLAPAPPEASSAVAGPNASVAGSVAAQTPPTANASVDPSGARSYALASPGEAAAPPAAPPPAAAIPAAAIPAAAPPAAPIPAAAIPHGSTDPGSAASPAVGTGSALPSNGAVAPPVSPAAGTASPIPHNSAAAPKPSGFGIQLGAFSTEAGAKTEWHLLASRFVPDLRGLQEHVVPAQTPSGRIYRLQAAVGDEGRARSICDSLRRHGQACVAVLPH